MVTMQELKEFSLFREFGDSELNKIAALCREQNVSPDTLLFAQGNKATKLHLCRSGRVDIVVRLSEPQGIEVVVHRAKTGDLFGWSSLVEPFIYTASAKCMETTETIFIEASDLIRLFEENPTIGYIFMKNLTTVISLRLTEYRTKLGKEIAAAIRKEW